MGDTHDVYAYMYADRTHPQSRAHWSRVCARVACFGADCSSEYLLASRMQARDSVVRVTKSERCLSLSLKIFMNNA